MKSRIVVLFGVLFSLSCVAAEPENEPVVIGNVMEAYHERAMADWGTALTEGSEQCNMLAKFGLFRGQDSNYLLYDLDNRTKRTFTIKHELITATFDSGRDAKFELAWPSRIQLQPSRRTVAAARFPSKRDFQGANSMRVTIPIFDVEDKQVCTITHELKRNTSTEPDWRSVGAASTTEVVLGMGSVFHRTGDLSKISNSSSFGMSFVFYSFPTLHHGFHGGLTYDAMSNPNRSLISIFSGNNPDPNVDTGSFFFGYTYRALPAEGFELLLDLAPGFEIVSISKEDGEKYVNDIAFSTVQRLSLDYKFGYSGGAPYFGLGFSLEGRWIPAGSAGPIEYSGTSLAWMLRLKLTN